MSDTGFLAIIILCCFGSCQADKLVAAWKDQSSERGMSQESNFRSGYLERGYPLGMLNRDVALIADNTVVNLEGVSMVRITSDNTTAANRTFTLTDGKILGHAVLLILISAGATSAELLDTGNVALSAAWTPLQYDTLTVVWNGTVWGETARSDN